QAVWTVTASAGVTALLVASAPAFAALRLAGAAYLVWLGVQAMWAALRPRRPVEHPGEGGAVRGLAPRAAFRQGVVSNLGNPKMAVFFTSLLPQFAPAGDASFSALLALGILFCTMTLAWLACYAVAIGKAGQALARPRVRRVLEGLTGAVLVALGARLALGSR
ncbi:MAG: LysE family translocator, partial [Candidatus Rokuibacteriota bacterium]